MDFLSKPESVNKLIVASQIGLPALTGIVKELENQFGNCALFPLNHNAKDYNAPNRRNIGWMVRFVMREYGYTPVSKGTERSRIGKFSGSKYLGTSAIYEKTISNPNRTIVIIDK